MQTLEARQPPHRSALAHLALYFRPHLFGVTAAVAVAWMVRTLSVMGGECRVLCNPPITIAMGLLGGLLGAQLYRSENPVRPPRPRLDLD